MGTIRLISVFLACLSTLAFGQIVNNNSILYNGQIGVIPLVGSHALSNKYTPLLVDANGLLQVIDVDSPSYVPAATTTVVDKLAKVFITAGDGKPVQGAPIVGVFNGSYKPIATDGLGRLIITAPAGTGLSSLNNLNASDQVFATGTTGTDFNIASTDSTHTFHIPSASATARGLVTTGVQTFAGAKTFTAAPVLSSLSTGLLHSDSGGAVTSSTLVDADVSASAAIAYSKLAPLASANILVGNGSNVATSAAMTGDVTISNTAVTSLAATLAGNKTFSNNVTVSGILTANGVLTSTAAQNIKAQIVTTSPISLNGASNVVLTNSVGAITINLPDCDANEGRIYIIKNINTGTTTITPVGAQKIDGAASKAIAVKYSSMNLLCTSSNWYVY